MNKYLVILLLGILCNYGVVTEKVKAITPIKSATKTTTKTVTKSATKSAVVAKAITSTFTPTSSRTSTRTITLTSSVTSTSSVTPTRTATATSTATRTLTRSKTPTRTVRPSRTPVPAIVADIMVDDDETFIFVPTDEDICEGIWVGDLSSVVVQFTQSLDYGIPITGGRCYTSGNYDVLSVYFDSLSRGKNYVLKTLPVWVATPTNTRTYTPTSTQTPTMTPTATSTPTTTPSPTITVIPNFRVDLQYIGTKKLKAFAGNVCAVGSITWLGVTSTSVVVEFTEDIGTWVSITDARCSARGYNARDVLNFLQRNGETFTEAISIP